MSKAIAGFSDSADRRACKHLSNNAVSKTRGVIVYSDIDTHREQRTTEQKTLVVLLPHCRKSSCFVEGVNKIDTLYNARLPP
jgi:hypothetical protein